MKNTGGLEDTIKNWMEDYLRRRKIRTMVKDEKDKMEESEKSTTGINFGTNNAFQMT